MSDQFLLVIHLALLLC